MNKELIGSLRKIKKGNRKRRYNRPPEDVYRLAFEHHDQSVPIRSWITKVCLAWWDLVEPR
jgi:hypothetical protein